MMSADGKHKIEVRLLTVVLACATLLLLAAESLATSKHPRTATIDAVELDCGNHLMLVHGEFRKPDRLIVTLNVGLGDDELPVLMAHEDRLQVELPNGCEPNGTYRLKVGELRRRSIRKRAWPVFQTFADFDVTLGAVGPEGRSGQDGVDGRDGEDGEPGAVGAAGLSCWDTNTNGICDPAIEDLSGDGTCSVADCAGAKGDLGNLALAGQTCPEEQFLTGFDFSGHIVCSSLDGGDDNDMPPPPIDLPDPQIVEDFLEALTGNEFSLAPSVVEASVPPAEFEGTGSLMGFAFCSPPNPALPPNASIPLYGCAPDVDVELVQNSGTEISLVVTMDILFADMEGAWTASLFGTSIGSGMFDAYALWSSVRVQATAPLIDSGPSTKRIGMIDSTSISFGDSALEVDFNSGAIAVLGDLFLGIVENLLLSIFVDSANEALEDFLNDVIAALPDIAV